MYIKTYHRFPTGSLSFLTGGDIFYYPSFNSDKHGKKLFDDVKSLLSRTFGYNALLKVRVSSGELSVRV